MKIQNDGLDFHIFSVKLIKQGDHYDLLNEGTPTSQEIEKEKEVNSFMKIQ